MLRLGLLFFFVLVPHARAEAPYSGFVTPTSMTIGFTDVRLRKVDGKVLPLLSGKFTHEFKRVDTDLTPANLDTRVNVPHGRYIGVQVCYDTSRRVKLDGVKYEGQSVSGFNDGDTLYSVGQEALASNSISKTNPGAGAATTMTNYLYATFASFCHESYFPVPTCVGEASRCVSGDNIIDPATKTAQVTLVFDLYHSVAVNAETKNISNGVYLFPYAMIGSPGAGVHLGSTSGAGARSDISLIFDESKRLVHAIAYGQLTDKGFCPGVGLVTVNPTPVPSGAYLNVSGPTAVTRFDSSGTGFLQFASSDCAGTSSCSSKGVMRLTGLIKPQGQTVSVDCVKDDSADPPYLGFSYKAGAGGSGGSSPFTIHRIVDPKAIFGQCTGTCGDYP